MRHILQIRFDQVKLAMLDDAILLTQKIISLQFLLILFVMMVAP